jgi:hypothetical protein
VSPNTPPASGEIPINDLLGELLQRMSDPAATYGLALPDSQQYRGLAGRLPALAWQRMRLTVLFVSKDDAGRYTVRRVTTPS